MAAQVSRPQDRAARDGAHPDRGEDLQRARAVAAAWQRELPDVPTRSIALVWLVKAVAVALRNARAGALDRLGIDAATLDLLSTLRRSGPPYQLTTRQLTERCLVSAGAISQRITRAEREGLVLRSAGEGRSVQVALTPAGHRVVEQSAGEVLQADEEFTAAIGDEDLERLEQLLSTWLSSIRLSGSAE